MTFGPRFAIRWEVANAASPITVARKPWFGVITFRHKIATELLRRSTWDAELLLEVLDGSRLLLERLGDGGVVIVKLATAVAT